MAPLPNFSHSTTGVLFPFHAPLHGRFAARCCNRCLAVLIFTLTVWASAFGTGAGKSGVPCQGTVITRSDDIVSIINDGQQGQTFCIEGEHRITATIHLKDGQTLIGTTTNSRISGAVAISPWQATSTQGVYYYDGSYADTQPHQLEQFGGDNVCYWVSTYLDDIFFRTNSGNDQRVMRVLSEKEVDPTQKITTPGQAVTAAEAGRFFFDYTNHRIYLSLPGDQDPNTATIDLAVSLNNPNGDTLLEGGGQNNVTLQNLFIEKSMNYGIWAGTGWTLKDMTIRFIHNIGLYGLRGAANQPSTIDDTLLTNNGRKAIGAGFTTNIQMTNSEMSWNNIANFRKSSGAVGSDHCGGYGDAGAWHLFDMVGTRSQPALAANNLWSHDNIGHGLWADGGTQYLQITNSTFSGNESYGYDHEISCQILFSNNTVYGNGFPIKNPGGWGAGVIVSDSNYGTFQSNLIYGNNGYGFHLQLQKDHTDMLSNPCLGAKSDSDTSNSLKRNQVLSNTMYSCSVHASIGKVWGTYGPLNSRGNQYQSNQYHLSDSTSNWFTDGNDKDQYVPQNWTTWQQGNHDSQGSLTVGCEYGHRREGPHRPPHFPPPIRPRGHAPADPDPDPL